MASTKLYCSVECGRRGNEVTVFKLTQPQGSRINPSFSGERLGPLILIDFRRSIALHPLGKSQVVVSERIVGIQTENVGVTTNGQTIIFQAERIVRVDIADLSRA